MINLEQRTDRWDSVIREAREHKLELTRVNAILAESIDKSECIFMPSGVVATWKSHQAAFSQFLSTSESHCIIFEDDFIIPRMTQLLSQVLEDGYDSFDFVQVGFLITNKLEFLDLKFQNLFDILKKLLAQNFLRIGFMKSLGDRLTISEQIGIPFDLVMNDIRAGGHAYIISRKFAEAGLKMNAPVFFSTDGVFMALGKSRNFKMARFRKSRIGQTNSPSSVTKRFI